MNLFRILVALISGAAGYGMYRLALTDFPASDLRSAVGVLVGANAALLGFLVSAGALLYAVANTTLARNLQRTGHFNNLLADLFFCATAFFLAVSLTASSLFLPPGVPEYVWWEQLTWLQWATVIAATVNTAALMLLVPVGRKMWLLLSCLQPDNPGRLE
jgi:hypothetical protein